MDYLKLSFRIGHLKFHTVNISKSPMNSSIPSHVHSLGSYELHYIYEGLGKLVANGTDFSLSKGMLYLTGPNTYHEQIFIAANPMSEICINFSVEKLPNEKPTLISRSFLNHDFWIGNDTENLMPFFDEMFLELKRDSLGNDVIVTAFLMQLVVKIVRNYEHFNLPVEPSRDNDINALRFLLIERIFLNQYNTITLSNLAEQIGLSIRQTERLLKEYYHSNFQKKKQEARMAAAKLLLESTDKKIYEIAELIGYSTPEHFCNVFRKYYQISAKEFRVKSRKNNLL